MMTSRGETPRHRVFISFHNDDQRYKDRFVPDDGRQHR